MERLLFDDLDSKDAVQRCDKPTPKNVKPRHWKAGASMSANIEIKAGSTLPSPWRSRP